MTVVAGVDGCRGGWIWVRRDLGGAAAEIEIRPDWRQPPRADVVAVDMPIGLPESGRRGCDRLYQISLIRTHFMAAD